MKCIAGTNELTLRLTWLVLVFPVVLLTCSPSVITPLSPEGAAPIANPFKIPFVNFDVQVVSIVMDLSSLAVLLAGPVLLVLRYRSADERTRRAMRWLLAPVALLPIAVVATILLRGTPPSSSRWSGRR